MLKLAFQLLRLMLPWALIMKKALRLVKDATGICHGENDWLCTLLETLFSLKREGLKALPLCLQELNAR